MEVVEAPRYSIDYLDPEKRSIANAVQITFSDGSQTERVEIEYPLDTAFDGQESLPKHPREVHRKCIDALDKLSSGADRRAL